MSLMQLKTADFGKSRTGLTGSVGFTLYNVNGSVYQARTTGSIYEIVPGSGIYASYITFPNDFRGSIFWDSGEDPSRLVYAVEQYNYEENNPNVDLILSSSTETLTTLQIVSSSVENISTTLTIVSSSVQDISSSILEISSSITQISSGNTYISSSITNIQSDVTYLSQSMQSLFDVSQSVESMSTVVDNINTTTLSNNILIGSIYTDVQFIKDIEGGRWIIDTALNQMIFYKSDNTTVVARFNLYDSGSNPTSIAPFERRRV